jgi:hypothetical protein
MRRLPVCDDSAQSAGRSLLPAEQLDRRRARLPKVKLSGRGPSSTRPNQGAFRWPGPVIAPKDGKVYVLLYLALAEHYFAATLTEGET